VPGRPIRVLAPDGCWAAWFEWGGLSAVDRDARRRGCCEQLSRCCERDYPMLRTVVHATFNDRCWDQCYESVCGMLRVACVQHSVFQKITKGETSSLPRRPWLSRVGGGLRAGRPNLRSAHREEWLWRISSRGSSAPHRMEPSLPILEPLLDALLEGNLQIWWWCPSLPAQDRRPASMGALRQLRPTARGQCFRRCQLGRLDLPHPRIQTLQCCCEKSFWDVGGWGYPCTASCWNFGDFC
jgi:hypothetical protein